MDISLGGVKLLVGKRGMGEEKNRNHIGNLPHDFHIFLHQYNPLKFVVLRPVRVLIVDWLSGAKKLLHH